MTQQEETYIRSIVARIEETNHALRGVLRVKNAIPPGGMGSSTATLVAICKALHGDTDDSKNLAWDIECGGYPGNSGLDIAFAWTGQPIVYEKGKDRLWKQPPSDILPKDFLLIDAGKPNETTLEIVRWVRDNTKAFMPHLETIARCTQRLLEGESCFTVLPAHHRAQMAMDIVSPFARHLIDHIERNGGVAKVMGASGRTGGGGMILAIPPDGKTHHDLLPVGCPVRCFEEHREAGNARSPSAAVPRHQCDTLSF